MANNEIKFEITQHVGIISTDKNGYTKELNIVHWNDSPKGPVYDIRSWNNDPDVDKDHRRMTRGVTLSYEEASRLAELLSAAV